MARVALALVVRARPSALPRVRASPAQPPRSTGRRHRGSAGGAAQLDLERDCRRRSTSCASGAVSCRSGSTGSSRPPRAGIRARWRSTGSSPTSPRRLGVLGADQAGISGAGRGCWWAGREPGLGVARAERGETSHMWLKSPPHRQNMLTPRWREVGIGGVHALAAPGVYEGLDAHHRHRRLRRQTSARRTALPFACAPVAQGTERRPSKPRVGGSNPPRRTLASLSGGERPPRRVQTPSAASRRSAPSCERPVRPSTVPLAYGV